MGQTLVFNAPTMSCCGAPRAQCRCQAPTANVPPADDASREASKRTVYATIRTVDPDNLDGKDEAAVLSRALSAGEKAKAGDSKAAADAHRKAADMHDELALKARMEGQITDSAAHDRAAQRHRDAVRAHSPTDPPTIENHMTDEQFRASLASLASLANQPSLDPLLAQQLALNQELTRRAAALPDDNSMDAPTINWQEAAQLPASMVTNAAPAYPDSEMDPPTFNWQEMSRQNQTPSRQRRAVRSGAPFPYADYDPMDSMGH